MTARHLVVGTFVLALAAGAFVRDGAGAPAIVPSPAPSPTVLQTPAGEPSPGTSPQPQATASPIIPRLGGIPLLLPSASPTQPYATFVRGADRLPGVLDLIRKDDDLFLDLRPENFGKPYVILPSIASGVGGDAFAGRVYDPIVVIFKRLGKRVLWVTPNARFVADKGTAAAASLAVSVADSVVQSTPIVAEDGDKTHTVINPSLFLTDFEGIGADLGKGAAPPSLPGLLVLSVRPTFAVDASKSYYLSTKAFPQNDEIAVNLAFNGPANALPTVPDGRGIPIVVHYSIVAAPAPTSYVPREADDRVGYFVTARQHYDNDINTVPTQRFIQRWNLAAGPIVFTLTDEIPPAYRATVRRAILGWNAAFAPLGYPHAIDVRDPPASGFDPDDARYNPIRWITTDGSLVTGITQNVTDPDTGRILRSTVVIDGESVRAVRRGYVDQVQPLLRARAAAFALSPAAPADASECAYEDGIAPQAALGMSRLLANPHVTDGERDAYAQGFVFAVVMHEVGHALGLRHNFAGSTAFTYAQLHDPAFTHRHGITASVMDYTPPNLAAPGDRQADVFPAMPGIYDRWAIAYGYTRTGASRPEGERAALHAIAARSTEPGHAYQTDEDAVPGIGLDPRAQRFDLSSDPLRFAQAQFAIDGAIGAGLTRTYRGDQRSYQDLRQTFVTVLNGNLSAALIAARYIGGIETSRAHRGQPGGTAPLRPVARSEQRRAFDLLARHVFAPDALVFPPALLNEVVPLRFGGGSFKGGPLRPDFPIRAVTTLFQETVLAAMFNPNVINRIADESVRARPGETMDLADLFAWTNAAIYDDLSAGRIPPMHADLQRRFLDLQIEIALLPSGTMDLLGLPRELQADARYQLTGLDRRLSGATASSDLATAAHLDDLRFRVRDALRAAVVRPL